MKGKQQDLKKRGKALDRMNEAEETKNVALAECERKDVKAREDQKRIKSSLKSLSKNLDKERQRLEELQTAPERLAKEIEEAEKKKIQLDKSLSTEDQK